jgi:hypothetical protein
MQATALWPKKGVDEALASPRRQRPRRPSMKSTNLTTRIATLPSCEANDLSWLAAMYELSPTEPQRLRKWREKSLPFPNPRQSQTRFLAILCSLCDLLHFVVAFAESCLRSGRICSQPQCKEVELNPKPPFVSESTKRTRFAKTVRSDVRDKWRRTLGGVKPAFVCSDGPFPRFFPRAIGRQLERYGAVSR